MGSRSTSDLGAVIVIGGCGLLRRHIVQFLLDNGTAASKITVFDISTENNRFAGVQYIAGDLAVKDSVAAALEEAQTNVIINVASPDAMTPDQTVFWRCNITGVQNIIQRAQVRGIRVLGPLS